MINKPGVRGFADCSIKGSLGCLLGVLSLTEVLSDSVTLPLPKKRNSTSKDMAQWMLDKEASYTSGLPREGIP